MSARRSSSKQYHPEDTTPGNIGVNKIHNHADTTCVGPNWRLIELTGEYYRVSPFSAEYQPKPDFPIAKCATTGNSVVLVADQVLWFANGLHCSSINPHQIRAYGYYSVCDNPWDPHRQLGIDLGSIFVPLTVSGPNLSFESCVPTDWEMSNLLIVKITSTTWNPADMHQSAPRSNPTHVVDCISTARRGIWSPSTVSQMSIFPTSDSRCVSSLYANAVLVHDALTGTHGSTSGISAAFTSERHSSVMVENLSCKWNIGLETTKQTLQVTTQRGIKTAVHPLHRRYRADHLHLNRRRLNGDWFTDTLFSKVILIQGSMCAQVFNNGSFTTVHPLDSKAKVAQVLTNFADDVGIPNSLLSEGAPEIVKPRTNFMKEVNRLKIS